MPVCDSQTPIPPAAPAPRHDDVVAVYARYAAPLYRFILRKVGDPSVAEDLAQDVFVRMLAGLPQYEERGYPISAWLYRIAACRTIDWLRVHGRRRTESLDCAAELASTGWPDGENTAVDREAEQQTLAAALAQLSERQAAVLRLRFFAELPIAEVARQLDLTPGAVKALQHRALATLRHQLITQGAYHPAEAA